MIEIKTLMFNNRQGMDSWVLNNYPFIHILGFTEAANTIDYDGGVKWQTPQVLVTYISFPRPE